MTPWSLDDLDGTWPTFLVCALSGIGIPLPEDVPLLWSGIRIAEGRTSWREILPVLLAGVAVRDVVVFLLGRFVGERLLGATWFQARPLSRKVDQARAMLAERGPLAVLLGRFMVGFRVPVFFAAGASGVAVWVFLLWDGLALLVSVPLITAVGFYAGPPVLEVARQVSAGSGAAWALVVAVGAALAWRWRKQRVT